MCEGYCRVEICLLQCLMLSNEVTDLTLGPKLPLSVKFEKGVQEKSRTLNNIVHIYIQYRRVHIYIQYRRASFRKYQTTLKRR